MSHIPNAVLLLVLFSCWICGTISSAISEDEDHICRKTRLVKLLDHVGQQDDWSCENYFPFQSCKKIRSGDVNFDEVFIPAEELICCPGWMRDDLGFCRLACPEGLYGEDCRQPCHCVHGHNGQNCDPVDGQCECQEGWTGRDCNERCPPGSFGKNCNESTLPCLNEGINDPLTGECLCPVTHQGEFCGEQCPSCVVECHNCADSHTEVCDTVIAACRCKAGWTGYFCTEPCPSGSGGMFCAEECCSGNGLCLDESKSCRCNDGYRGENCEEKCVEGTFGPDCSQKCLWPHCDHVTGQCHQCPIGYTGESCTSICSEGRWGPGCNESCHCEADELCDIFTGTCSEVKITDYSRGDEPQPSVTITGALTAAGGLVLLVLVAIIMYVSIKCLKRKDTQSTPNEAFPSLNIKSDTSSNKRVNDSNGELRKDDYSSVYQEIDDYPSRYTKPALPSAPPGIPLYKDQPSYERVLNQFDPDYLVPDVK